MGNRGQTQIQWLVGITLLGAVASVALPLYTTAISDAQAAVDQLNTRSVDQALRHYYQDHLRYPLQLDQLIPVYIDQLPTLQQEERDWEYQVVAGGYQLRLR